MNVYYRYCVSVLSRRAPTILVCCQRLGCCVLLLMMAMQLSACKSRPAQFYVMNPVLRHGQLYRHQRVLVGPLTMASYLQRSQIVTRLSANQIHVDEFQRWAQPLRDNVKEVLVQNLRSALHSNYVFPYHGNINTAAQYQVAVTIERFDVSQSGLSLLKASWYIKNPLSNHIVMAKTRTFRQQIYLGNTLCYQCLVRSMNQNLDSLSQAIAASIRGSAR